MGRAPTPTIRRWQLGQELRRLRLLVGISLADAAKACSVSTSNMSRIEGGKQTIKESHVRVVASMTGVHGEDLDDLLTLCEEAARPEWYHAIASSAPTWFRQYLGFEAAATEIRTYTVELIDGRMQTEDYARAVAVANQPEARGIDNMLAVRRGRQARLVGDDPPRLHVVMNQVALVANTGGPPVMRAQIDRLIELSGLEHVTLQVLPFGAGAHPAMTAPFTMLGFDRDFSDMSTVYLENGRGAVYLDAQSDLDRYAWSFGQLSSIALSPDDTRELLVRVGSDL